MRATSFTSIRRQELHGIAPAHLDHHLVVDLVEPGGLAGREMLGLGRGVAHRRIEADAVGELGAERLLLVPVGPVLARRHRRLPRVVAASG